MIKNINAALVALAVSAVACVAVAAEQSPQAPTEMEKCFGVAKANTKGDGSENGSIFVNVPKGKCEMLENGSLKPVTASKTSAPAKTN